MEVNRQLAGDILVPAQHFAARRALAPEVRLMVAVVNDAINCVEKYRFAKDHRGRRLFEEVTQWLLAEEASWPYSFKCICECLNLDSSTVRHRLRLAPTR